MVVEVLTAVKNAPLKISFLVHFFLSAWGMQGYWSPNSYIFYNAMFFVALMWAIHTKDSIDAPLMCLLINLSSVVLDVIVLISYFPKYGSANRFSAAMAVLNMIIRPLSCLAIYQLYKDRKDLSEGRGGQPGSGRGYEGIAGGSYGSTEEPNI